MCRKSRKSADKLAAEVEKNATVITDLAITGYVDRIAQKVAASAWLRGPLTIKVVAGLEGYATTLPGGFCFVNSDLIQTATSEAELAGAIAHQVGHLALWRETSNANSPTIPSVFIGRWGGLCLRGIDRPVIPMGLLATQREAESKADVLGIGYMEAAGYDPRALADFFERTLQPKPGSTSRVFEPWAVFPSSTRSQAEATTNAHWLIVTTSEFGEIQRRLADLSPKPAPLPLKPPSLKTGH